MKLSVNLFMTLNGVSQAPGGPQEDTRGGFSDGGWLFSVWDDGCATAVSRWFEHCGALLLGRKTFDTFAGHWPHVTDPADTVAELKQADSDLELQVHGSIQLARTLHEAGLVDVYRFLIAPVTVGPGQDCSTGQAPPTN